MATKSAISGFPEWLPEQRWVEQRLMAALSHLFELHGYTSLDTRSVELLETLAAKGTVDKEVYGLQRLQAARDDNRMRLGLHFDLTVPFARYVVEHQAQLNFPFKRYQIQRVWRGERPQEGRFREFYQADFDVIADRPLPAHAEVEIADILLQAFQLPPMPAMQLHVSHRAVFDGVCQALAAPVPQRVLMVIDRLAKVGEAAAKQALIEEAHLSPGAAETCLQVARLEGPMRHISQAIGSLVELNAALETGLTALSVLTAGIERLHGAGSVHIDFGIVRGLDYYTGVVYEGFLRDQPRLGAVCSGGRYDNLTGHLGQKRAFPGTGVSLGITRILAHVFNSTEPTRWSQKTPSQLVIVLGDAASQHQAEDVAKALRQRHIACEVYPFADKFAKQIQYASKKGIRYVLFPTAGTYDAAQVRDLNSGEQQAIDYATWTPAPREQQKL